MRYILIDNETKKVFNIIELLDQSTLPAVPDESQRPIEPIAPEAPDFSLIEVPVAYEAVIDMEIEEESRNVERDNRQRVLDEEYAVRLAEYHGILASLNNAYEAEMKKYQDDMISYKAAAADYHTQVQEANRYRYTPPAGSLLVQNDNLGIGDTYIAEGV